MSSLAILKDGQEVFYMEKIILRVPRIQLRAFEKSSFPNQAYFSLVLENSLIMNGVHIGLDESKMADEEREHIYHNDAMADLRLLDKPLYHRRKKNLQDQYLLSDYLSSGINEFVNRMKYDEVRAFLEGSRHSLDDSEFFRPSRCKGTMRIPVEFIDIYGLSGHNRKVTANVMLGHHFVYWGVPVYPVFDPKGKIIDQRLIAEVKKILSRRRAKKLLKYLAGTNSFNHENHIIDKVAGCNREKIPPIRFY